MFTGIVNFDFRKCEKIHPRPHFQKLMLMFTGIVNFDFRKCEKCPFFEKSPPFSKAHFQKLMFTGIVNFDFRKCEKFFENSAAHFQRLMFKISTFENAKNAAAAHFQK